MSSVQTAAVAAIAYAGLFAGHQLGDHVLQGAATALAKAAPTDDRLAAGVHPWTGWRACARHVVSYTAAQAAALALVAVVAPLTAAGAAAALTVSASTHAVIDRRWPVHAVLRAKGAGPEWAQGVYLVDQSLHFAALLVAAVLAATVHTPAALAATVSAGATLLAGALLVELRRAHIATTGAGRVGDPHRL